MAFIYKITNKINGKIYIGKTEKSIERRFKEHCAEFAKARSKDRPLYRAFNKYGIENFSIELIEITDIPEEREMFWINFYQSYQKGYNATLGGDGKAYIDKSQILPLYAQGLNSKQIAEQIGCCREIVLRFLRACGLSTKENANKISQKKVVCIETGVVFDSVSAASMFLVSINNKDCDPKMYGTHISACCRGKRKTILGYSFKYQG